MILAGQHAGPDQLARFQVEAEAIARLKHDYIVQIYDIGEHQGLPFFSLELVEGGSLSKKLVDSPLLPEQAAHLLEKLALGMDAAHQRGIIHRSFIVISSRQTYS
jgi:serine/threonine-protein kinase